MNQLYPRFQQRVLLLFSLLFIASAGFSQNNTVSPEIQADPRLYDCFTKEYVESLQSQPKLLLYYNFYLDHAYFIAEVGEKPAQGKDIREINYKEPDANGNTRYFDEDLSQFNPAAFNALKYDFRVQKAHYTHYLLGTTGKVLIFYPQQVFSERFNEHLSSFDVNPK